MLVEKSVHKLGDNVHTLGDSHLKTVAVDLRSVSKPSGRMLDLDNLFNIYIWQGIIFVGDDWVEGSYCAKFIIRRCRCPCLKSRGSTI